MIIARRINEISGILDLNLNEQSRKQYFLQELKTPSLSLQWIALTGLLAAYAVAPPFVLDIGTTFSACVLGLLLGILVSHLSRNYVHLNIGGFSSMLFAGAGFRLILIATERAPYWTLPLGALMAVSVAVIISGPLMYLLLMATMWKVLPIDLHTSVFAHGHGLWPQLLIGSAMLIGLLISMFLHRLRHLNQVCTLRLVDMAYKDHLTAIPNRRWFMEAVTLALQRRQLDGYLLMLDIDDFKRVNDEAGHDTGDAVLRQVGAIIGDVAAGLPHGRLGGEEFAIVARGRRGDAEAIAARLLQAVRATPIAGRRVTVSIGACVLEDENISRCMRLADEALYRAKLGGKDRVEFNPEPVAVVSRLPSSPHLESTTS
ncbi:GGDEF domain-containing protein [Duganella sp. FT27W]|uniref:GGDEF domain-containing protein n=1 Tax=Duganella sp. FT27W TaxID=2654636 RepID=UPI00186B6FA7|nr:GGDEF domain-containing protein [Duganella sp. FT27W]